MKALLVGDIHAMDKPPASVTEHYQEDILEMLRYVAKLEKSGKYDIVVWAGDVFNFKQPTKNSHKLVQDMLRVAQEYNNLYIVVGNHDLCVSEDTQALTDKGWRTVNELDGTEKFATLVPGTHEIEFHSPYTIRHFPYSGKAYEVGEFVTTPNHKWYAASSAKNPYDFYTSEQLSTKSYRFSTPRKVGYKEGKRLKSFNIGGFELSPYDAARLIGWFLAEGTCEPQRVTISQSNEVNPEHYAEIVDILESNGIPFSATPKMIRINSSKVAAFFRENFGNATSRDVTIPEWLFEWSKDDLTTMLYAYFRGDGTIQGTVAKRAEADYSTASIVARSRNEALADGLTALAELCGYHTSVSELKEFPFTGTDYVGHAYNIGFNQNRASQTIPIPKETTFDGMVWCPSLPNHTWLMRRNGVTQWTGNCYDRLDTLNSQPLGVLFTAGVKQLVGWNATDVKGKKLPVMGIPWQQDWLEEGHVKKAFEEYNPEGESFEDSLVVTHCPIYPPVEAQKQLFELVPTSGEGSLSEAMDNTGYLYYGHIHEDHGFFTDGGTTFGNVGAISRGSLHEYNVERKIQVAEWSPENGFKAIEIPHRPADEVFFLEEKAAHDEEEREFSDFLSDISAVTLAVSDTESVVAYINTMDSPKPVKDRAVEILREVSS